MADNSPKSDAVAALSDGKRIAIIEQTLHVVVGLLEIHGAKLDAILEAATAKSGPSETTELLKEIVFAQAQTNELLQDLPTNIAVMFRDELERDEDDDELELESAKGANFDG